MFEIKKKLLAIAIICAMAFSMSACSDKKEGKEVNGIKTATLSSEEAESLKAQDLVIQEYIEPTDIAQDPVEGANDSSLSADNNANNNSIDNSAGNNNSVDNNANNNADNNNNSNADSGNVSEEATFNAEEFMEGTDMVMVPGEEQDNNNNSNNNNNDNSSPEADNNAAQNNNQSQQGNDNNNDNQQAGNNNSSTEGNQAGLIDGGNDVNTSVIQGTKKIQQAYWMNLSGNYVFDGEFITATFKIKDTTADGTYPITIEWIDLANIDAQTVKANGINGSVVVGGNAETIEFKNDGSFEVKADSVSGKAGENVTVSFRFNKNPGICASVFRFGYDSDALEYVGGEKGEDFLNALDTQNN